MKAFVLSCCPVLLLAFAAHGEERQGYFHINAGERHDGILDADNRGTWIVHGHNLDDVVDLRTGLVFDFVVDEGFAHKVGSAGLYMQSH